MICLGSKEWHQNQDEAAVRSKFSYASKRIHQFNMYLLKVKPLNLDPTHPECFLLSYGLRGKSD